MLETMKNDKTTSEFRNERIIEIIEDMLINEKES